MKFLWPLWPLSFTLALAQEGTVPAVASMTPGTTAVVTAATSDTSSAISGTVASPAFSPRPSSPRTSAAATEESTEKEQARLAAEEEWVNFKAIQKVLNNDQLAAPAQRQQQAMRKSSQRQQQQAKARFDIPTAENFWGFFTEFWVVKNINILQWDVAMPDYAIESHLVAWLQKLKMPPLKFKLLLLDTINICHLALPSNPGEVLFLLAVPFIRTLDLTQTEISLLLLEDLVRHQQGYLVQYLTTKDAQRFWGTNFKNNPKFQGKFIGELLQRLDEISMGTGFSFQQQFVVTNAVRELIKDDDKLLYAYQTLLKKIDQLVKNNPKYKNYLNIYPSPELQLNWLHPEKVKHID
ncbi:MAG: hypothetical protein J6Y94_01765 [Bacteriovoracaceae bacterium]|nr:hypothetical protein [Bacteriovoracaceae bacterium]